LTLSSEVVENGSFWASDFWGHSPISNKCIQIALISEHVVGFG